ncbi:MAG TPA: hypothetical protein VF060_06050 [Trebonia sp.]
MREVPQPPVGGLHQCLGGFLPGAPVLVLVHEPPLLEAFTSLAGAAITIGALHTQSDTVDVTYREDKSLARTGNARPQRTLKLFQTA